MSIVNWQAQAIIDAIHSNLDTNKLAIGLVKVVKLLNKNIEELDSLRDFIADAEMPYLYVGIEPNAVNDMRHETNVGIETDLHVALLCIARVRQGVGLPDVVDPLVKNILDYVFRDEFLSGKITEMFPESYMTSHEFQYPYAIFQINLVARYTWLHSPNP